MDDILVFLESHINTKRAKKSTPVAISKTNIIDNQLNCLAEYKLNFQYYNEKFAPSFIKLGLKNNRVCIRIDELLRVDRSRYIDYFADDLTQLRKLIRHLIKLQREYDRTTWFLRAQLIPTLFRMVINIFKFNKPCI